MTLQEVKDQTAKEHGYKGYKELVNSTNIPPEALEWYYNRVTEIYARSKWDEAFDVSISKFEFAKTKAKTLVELVQLDAVLAILEVTKNTEFKP